MNDFKPWSHRKRHVVYSVPLPNGKTIFYQGAGRGKIDEPVAICLGERYAHSAPGWVFEDEEWKGSLIDNWHGGPSGSLHDLIVWVSQAEHPTYKHHLWMVSSLVVPV